MIWTIARASSIAILLSAAPVVAQEFDPTLGVEAVAVLEDGRILVQNGETTFDCALEASSGAAQLADCMAQPAADSEASAFLLALTEADWRAAVRDTLQDAQCRLSAFTAIGVVLEETAAANGVSPETIERARAALSARAEAAVSQMLRDGSLTYRDGELALDACP